MGTVAPPICPDTMLLKEAQGSGPSAHLKEETDYFLSIPRLRTLWVLYTLKNQKMSVRKMQERKKGGHTCIQEPEDSVPVNIATLLPSKIQMQSFGRNWKTSFYFMCKRVWPKQPQTKRSSTEELRGTQWLRARTHKTMLVTTEGRKCLHYDS